MKTNRKNSTRASALQIFVSTALLCISAALLASSFNPAPVAASGQKSAQPHQPSVDTTSAIVELKGDPLSIHAKTRPAPGRKIDFNNSAVRAVRAELNKARNDFKSWLHTNAPAAKVTGEYDIALNAVSVDLNGVSLDTIARAPMVVSAEYDGIYYAASDGPNLSTDQAIQAAKVASRNTPDTADPDLSIIRAMDAWAQGGGPAHAGEGLKIAIIDSGIDITHPCFSDAGYPPQPQLGDHHFTNNKVIVAKVFSPAHGFTPEDILGHGTSVASIAACDYNTGPVVEELQGVTIPYNMSGVAPRALLGNYNVLPGPPQTRPAFGKQILNALEAAYQDGFDVANMSLNNYFSTSGSQDLVSHAINNLDKANMVTIAAAGNDGPGHYTVVHSPGSAARALTAGGSSVPRFVGAPVTVSNSTFAALAGEFNTVSSNFTAPLAVVTGTVNGLNDACSTLTQNLAGTVALISRGTCFFSTKIRNAQNAGAAAVLVANNVPEPPLFAMFQDGTPNQPTVPAYMISLDAGQALLTQNGEATTIGTPLQYIEEGSADVMGDFSSEGPTDVDYRIKPDVVAPGILGALVASPHTECDSPPCYLLGGQGTSLAAPHLAGSAAVVLQQHPTWSAAQVRSAIVNTADRTLKDWQDGTTLLTDVNIVGAGRENLLNAVQAKVTLDPVSVSFGAIPSGSGQSRNAPITLTNVSGSAGTFALAVEPSSSPPGVTFSASPSSVTLAPGQSATITVSVQADRGAANGDYNTYLDINLSGAEVAHAALYTLIR